MKHSGWNIAFSCDVLLVEEPEAVTMRPEIGRVQFAQVAVGTPARDVGLSHGRWDLVGESFGGEDLDGRGKGRCFGWLDVSIGHLWSGMETDIAGQEGSSGKLMVGTDGVSSQETLMEGTMASSSSGRLMVGTAGAETVIAGMLGLGRIRFGSTLSLDLGESPADFHEGSKLTIGRPARSLTAVGAGSFGLRSLSFMEVAARMSSLRISTLGFEGGESASGMISITGGGVTELAVYAALRD